MSRATTKQDLIEAANAQFDKLWRIIDSMTEEEQTAPFGFSEDFLQKQKEMHWRRDKNLRDVLVHLYEWHQLLLNWVKSNQAGVEKPFIPEPYNWKTYQQMNVGFWEKHQNTPYQQSRTMFKESHAEAMALIETFSNDELFSKNQFPWTGTSALGSYCVSATASHYDWAMKKLKQYIKAQKDYSSDA
jgi:hypothetical protein